jgi:hypothetical protein
MSRLYLRCAICSRQQADGLLSSAMWGILELPPGIVLDHPALTESILRACPACVGRDPAWQERLLVSLGIEAEHRAAREAAQ